MLTLLIMMIMAFIKPRGSNGGSEYGLDPDDFESEDAYNEALEEARDGSDAFSIISEV